MINFILLSLALLLVVYWLIVPVLLGKKTQTTSSSRETNTEIARQRIADIEKQLQDGEIDQLQYQQLHDEIDRALLEDIEARDNLTTTTGVRHTRTTWLILISLPFVAFGLYQFWGTPEAIMTNTSVVMPKDTNHANIPSQHTGDMQAMLHSLENKLQKNPNNPDGWYLLARSYMVQKQYPKAVDAFNRLRQLVGDQADLLAGLADAKAMLQNGDMRGEPFRLARQALELDPKNQTALWLTANGYRDHGNLKKALEYWQRLQPLLENDPQSLHEVNRSITSAQRQLGVEPVTEQKIRPASVLVNVAIDDVLLKSVTPDNYVMIYAQRSHGMRMPLAMIKKQVRDLPLTVTLDDNRALSPMNKLSDAEQVNIIARISKSGMAVKQEGDIEAVVGPVLSRGGKTVDIVLGP